MVRANYLRGIVLCSYCMKPFSSGITPKKLKDGSTNEHYYYRCETLTCVFRNKSVRSTQVTMHVINFLKEHRFTTKENYEYWIGKAKEQLKQTLKENDSRLASLNRTIALKEQGYERTKDLIRNNPVLQEHYDLKAQRKEVDDLKSEQNRLLQERNAAKDALPTYKKYLELFDNVSDILINEEEAELKDSVVRVFFSNFVVRAEGKGKQQRRDITHKLNEPPHKLIM